MQVTILDYIENSAKEYPNKIAFSDENNQISYKKLEQKSKSIGFSLINRFGKLHNSPIAVLINRSIRDLCSFFGIVYSGNFYIPIDVNLPIDRINLILKTVKPIALITPQKDLTILDGIKYRGTILSFEEIVNSEYEENQLIDTRRAIINTDPLYAIFTSGSTGIPKGVLIKHGSVINLIDNFTRIFGFSERTIIGNQAPFDFDVSVKDIYSTLKNGGTMHIIPKIAFSFPGKLIQYLNEKEINTIIWATSALRIVANLNALQKETPKYLEKVMFSGEVMPNKVLNYWRENIPAAIYVNLYGPTEITCNCTYFIVDRPFKDNEMLPIGRSFPNTDIFLLNEQNRLVSENESGEICVRGFSLALGYYNNPEETKKSFCQNPLNNHYPEKIYRTGDIGKYNDKNEILFLSRKDNQIKHMGHRIELGELEVNINALDFIENACCIYDNENEKIVLFYQARSKCDKEIVLKLKERLPRYMLPNKFVHFDQLPMNKNAKIDRARLKKEFL